MGEGNEEKLTKAKRREEAREQARKLRQQQQKKEKRNKVLLRGGISLAIVAIGVVVTLLIVDAVGPAGPGPKNMASDGIVIGKNLEAVRNDGIPEGGKPVASKPDRENGPIDIVLYADYMCPGCAGFERQNGELIQQYVGNGEATLEIHPISILDRVSLGTKYSTRAASAVSCVAEQQPDKFFAAHDYLLSSGVQPEENTKGLSNKDLLKNLISAGVENTPELEKCVMDVKFASFIREATDRAAVGPLPNTDWQSVKTTPTVLVNGEFFDASKTTFNDLILKYFKEVPVDEGTGDVAATPAPSPEATASQEPSPAPEETPAQ